MKRFSPGLIEGIHTSYQGILSDLMKEIRQYRAIHQKAPDYIIISTGDYESLLAEMYRLGILPNRKRGGELSFGDVSIIQSANFARGCFDVVGQ